MLRRNLPFNKAQIHNKIYKLHTYFIKTIINTWINYKTFINRKISTTNTSFQIGRAHV